MNPMVEQMRRLARHSDVIVGVSIIFILLLMVAPLTAFLMDLFLVVSLAVSIGILMIAVYSRNPLDASLFPSLLLVITLFRLSLNVASTRLILTHGHQGTKAAGSLIQSFGDFVVQGNYVVGLIVFLILIIINFVVITKGAGRVSEVAARFTLDALPGKQMAIDADLNAGLINDKEAKQRRKTIEEEADFYGSMDGASKFVRGDAIAGLLILLVNIIGGLIIGVAQKGLAFPIAAKNYTLLTVGDGLVSQIPALLISTAAGLVVTKTSSGKSLGDQAAKQFLMNENVFFVMAGVLFMMGIVLQGTFVPFSILAVFAGGAGYLLKTGRDQERKDASYQEAQAAMKQKEKVVDTPEVLDAVQLEVGYGLISVVENKDKGDLLERIQSVRRQFVDELGVVVPVVKIKDNLQLKPGEYVLFIRGAEVARGELMVDHLLAMDPGGVIEPVDGVSTKEPVFGLDAVWIHENKKELAQLAGYTVVDLSTVIATHLTEMVRKWAKLLMGRQEVQELLDAVKKTHPKVVDELVPKELSLGIVVKVLQNLLHEGISIRDLVTVLEALGDGAAYNKDPDFLTEWVRTALGRSICRKYLDERGELPLFTLNKDIEEALIHAVQPGERTGTTQFSPDPSLVRKLVPALSQMIQKLSDQGVTPVLLVTPILRQHVKKTLDRFLPQIHVMSHNEISSDTRVKSVGTVQVA